MSGVKSSGPYSLRIPLSKGEVMRCIENLHYLADLMDEHARGALASSMYPVCLKDAADALSQLWDRLEGDA